MQYGKEQERERSGSRKGAQGRGRLSPAMIGRAFTQLGFDSRIRHGLKGYIAVKRDDGQIKEYLNSLIGTGGADDEPF